MLFNPDKPASRPVEIILDIIFAVMCDALNFCIRAGVSKVLRNPMYCNCLSYMILPNPISFIDAMLHCLDFCIFILCTDVKHKREKSINPKKDLVYMLVF